MSAPVRYIDRTRDYYLGQGYDKPYEWAHHTDVPFTPLTKPLSESRIAIVSTSDIAIKKPDGSRDRDNEFSVGNVYSLPADTPVDLMVRGKPNPGKVVKMPFAEHHYFKG